MKVLHVINTLSVGGAELHLLTLCRYLKRINIEVSVACLREHVKDSRSLRADFERENIPIINLQADHRYDALFFVRLMRLLRAEQPDILHTHLPRADFAGAFASICHPDVIWASSVHDIHNKSWSGRWSLPLFNYVWSRADHVVAISRAVQEWLVIEHSVPRKKIKVIHYGIEPEMFAVCAAGLRQKWGFEGRFLIGTIGRLEPRKGHDCLIRAMSELRKTISNVCLIIAGHDPFGYGEELQLLIRELDLSDAVRLVGFQSDIVAFLRSLDVFAFASHSEGFGQVVVEAMAAEKPIAVTNISPLNEIVIDGETGILAESGNAAAFAKAISWLLLHPEEARDMGRRGKERVDKHFSAERMSNETVSMYEELIARSTDGRRDVA